MYSINQFENTPKFVSKVIDDWNGQPQRQKMIDDRRYYDGHNVTIEKVKKLVQIKNESGEFETKTNPFVSNFKISTNLVKKMVDQKVYTLLDKSPSIEGVQETTEKILHNKLDYTLTQHAVNASVYGTSFAYVEIDGGISFKVFDTPQCIPFYDDFTGELKALIRYWEQQNFLDDKTTYYAEVYFDKLYTYSKTDGDYELINESNYYSKIIGNAIQETEQPQAWSNGLPIIELMNNKDRMSDFTKPIRSKVDINDIVCSDFANNLADFQDVFWIIKGLDEVTAENMGSFIETIKNTYKASVPEGADVDLHQVQIPYQARMEFLNHNQKQLISEMEILNTELMLTGGLTATAIQVASQDLMTKVSKFEYFVYNATLKMIAFVMEFIGDNSSTEEIAINFKKGGVKNDTEIIQNILSSSGIISQKTMLEHHPYVDNVDEELAQIDKEGINKFSVEGGVDDGFSSQENGSTT